MGGNLSNKLAPNAYLSVNSNVVYGGTLTGGSTISTQVGSVTHVPSITLDLSTGNAESGGTGTSFSSLKGMYSSLATNLAGLTANGTMQTVGNTLNLTGTSTGQNVFTVSASTFGSDTVNIIAPNGSTVVVNIVGTTANNSGSAINLTGVNESNVVYNFVNATTFSSSSRLFEGSVLAMDAATSTLTGGAINGLGVFGGNVTTSQGFEFHDFPADFTVVPEPSSLALTAIGLTATTFAGLRTRRKASGRRS